MDMQDMGKRLLARLENIENTLAKIEDNGRPDDHVTNPTKRFDGRQIEVQIRCNVMQLGDIDNVNQEFKAYLYFSAKYVEPNLRGVRSEKDVDWANHWDPRIVFINATNIEQLDKKVYINEYDEEADAPVVNKTFRIRATFKEKLELQDFPFDFQELNIVLMSDWPAREVRFVKDMRIKDSVNTSNFQASQSWELKPYITGKPLDIQEESGSHRKYPYYSVTLHVTRHLGFYLWNIALVMVVIMGLTFSSFAVPISETGDRISVSVTLLLTSVAFKFIVSQSLPTISYLTILDAYVLLCMMVQVLITVQNAVSSIWADPSYAEQAKLFDTISACVLVGLVFIYHLVFLIIILVKVHKRNKLIRKSKNVYEQLCDVINEDFQRKKKLKSNNQVSPSPPQTNALQQTLHLDNEDDALQKNRGGLLEPIDRVPGRPRRKRKAQKGHLEERTWHENLAHST